jgi:hypothetical protein
MGPERIGQQMEAVHGKVSINLPPGIQTGETQRRQSTEMGISTSAALHRTLVKE